MADIDGTIRTLRVGTSAILVSLLTFAGVAAAFRSQVASTVTGELQSWLPGALAVVAAFSAVAYVLVYRQMRAHVRGHAAEARASAEPLAAVLEPYRRFVIVRAALIEAPGLVALMTYLTGGSEAAVSVAGVSALLLLSTVPSRAGLQRFADDVLQ